MNGTTGEMRKSGWSLIMSNPNNPTRVPHGFAHGVKRGDTKKIWLGFELDMVRV